MAFLAALPAVASAVGGVASAAKGLFNGGKGSDYQAMGATEDQANTAYGQTQDAIGKQKQFVDAVNAANGVGNQSQVFDKLGNIVNGTGPNPAQAMLAQATGANVANQAALMAGQRGAGANAGLLARQAAQQGAGIQQNAIGQGATLQANQSLNALGQQGQIAGQQVAQQANALQGYNAATQGQQQNILGSINNQNSANSGVAQQNAKGQANLVSGLTGAAGSVLGLIGGGGGGNGGTTDLTPQNNTGAAQPGIVTNQLQGPQMRAQGGAITPQAAPASNVGSRMKAGGPVPGVARVPGNSYANDTVNAKLSPGEVVIPLSVMQSADPVKNAAAFVQAVMAKQGRRC